MVSDVGKTFSASTDPGKGWAPEQTYDPTLESRDCQTTGKLGFKVNKRRVSQSRNLVCHQFQKSEQVRLKGQYCDYSYAVGTVTQKIRLSTAYPQHIHSEPYRTEGLGLDPSLICTLSHHLDRCCLLYYKTCSWQDI